MQFTFAKLNLLAPSNSPAKHIIKLKTWFFIVLTFALFLTENWFYFNKIPFYILCEPSHDERKWTKTLNSDSIFLTIIIYSKHYFISYEDHNRSTYIVVEYIFWYFKLLSICNMLVYVCRYMYLKCQKPLFIMDFIHWNNNKGLVLMDRWLNRFML